VWAVHRLVAFILLVTVLAACGGRRLRPWFIGVSLITCGFAAHVAFELWVADFAGRAEMGGFAVVEAILFLAGLALGVVSLVTPRPTGVWAMPRGLAWLVWLAVAFAAGYAVLDRLPP
jgi:hypothetical protein